MDKLAKIVAVLTVSWAFAALASSPAHADVTGVYVLTGANTSLCAGASCAAYGQVEIQINANTALLTVSSPSSLEFFGHAGMFGFNFRDEKGNVVPLDSKIVSSFTPNGSGQLRMDGQFSEYGRFDYVMSGPPAADALSSFWFVITCPTCIGSNPMTLSMFELSSGTAGYFSAHVICDTCGAGGSPNTGFIGRTIKTQPVAEQMLTPEPASLLLVGIGLFSMLAVIRQFSVLNR